MKVLIYSDLHLEWASFKKAPKDGYDFVVLAGDIGKTAGGINWATQNFIKPVMMVAGNHEFYQGDINEVTDRLFKSGEKNGVNFLNNTKIEFDGIRFLGATLWTDFRFQYDDLEYAKSLAPYLNDYHIIKDDNTVLKPERTIAEHNFTKAWLNKELATPFDGKTVVVTHHGPSAKSVSPQFIGDKLNHMYVSELDWLIEMHQPDLWVHGHVHHSHDYKIGNTRVVTNPRGYVRGHDVENKQFKSDFIVEV